MKTILDMGGDNDNGNSVLHSSSKSSSKSNSLRASLLAKQEAKLNAEIMSPSLQKLCQKSFDFRRLLELCDYARTLLKQAGHL